jgi:soluble lytic murein transglycosylase
VRHLDIINENAGELEPSLILAVIRTESSFRENAVSRSGAMGLMQIMPPTAEEMARYMGIENFAPEDVWQPEINIAIGCFYLNRLVNQYGDIDLGLAAYNAGQGNVNSWLANPEYSKDGKTLDTIPFPETDNYLRRVARNQHIYNLILRVTGRGI